jgi:small multidrug resistance pump
MMLAWIYLAAAIATEVVGTVFLRVTDGFTNPAPSILVLATYAASLWLTALALRELEISLAYAVWAGVGTAAVAVIGMALLGESVTALKLASIALVISGVVGLNLSGAN